MKRYRFFILFFIVLFILQFSFLPLIAVYGVIPDLLLLVTVSYAFLRGSKLGGLVGFALGLLQDLSVGSFFGLHAFTLTLIGLFFGRFSDRVFKEQFFLPITASVAATFAQYVISAVIVYLLGYRFNPFLHMGRVLILLLIFQLIFAYPIHWATFHLDKRVSEPKR
ncbi:rod shape-determining protein MreD [Selenomonas sp. F0473]|uniref:rod shape-determining protein MreD n=1 Tax=Selenomonas sp. F0473 TaxID=999423 RepID=UPI00029EA7C0|nr:rod shape-determining protein MreD [Selenomonas sp. F0473]EKU71493.1 rod shape-determining protein MreD [Selenomonas sp. F0473]